ncbi:MAG: FtsQ-type POTRA domain-containing protein [Methylococcaceae bacterium]|nr:FtsQ-type POTRA domain-containing protein [Methylococcaceae bacterium]
MVLIIVLIANFWSDTKRLIADFVPIRYVRIDGVFQYISKEALQKSLLPYVSTDFFSVDVQELDKAALQHPWIKSVSVKRVWPDAIDIKVTEQLPAVRWGDKGLLNLSGGLFTPENAAEFKQLPLIQGPKGYETRLLEIMKGLEKDLAAHALHLVEFKVNERRAWDILLQNGIEIKLGRNGQLKNFQRFLKTLDLLGQDKVAAIAKVDLRYPNGFSITWKADAPVIDWKQVVAPQQQI